ncbi:MAG: hypothetical protein GY842_04770 [bacterium]|nr:hypothetical protein [bacterium]
MRRRRNSVVLLDGRSQWATAFAWIVMLAAAGVSEPQGVADGQPKSAVEVYRLAEKRFALVAIPEGGTPLQVTVEHGETGWFLDPESARSAEGWLDLLRRTTGEADPWELASAELDRLTESTLLQFKAPDHRIVLRRLTDREVIVSFVTYERIESFAFSKQLVNNEEKWRKKQPVSIDLMGLLSLPDENSATLERVFQQVPLYDGWIRRVLALPKGSQLILFQDKDGTWRRLVESTVEEEEWRRSMGFATRPPTALATVPEVSETVLRSPRPRARGGIAQYLQAIVGSILPLVALLLALGLLLGRRWFPPKQKQPSYAETASALVRLLHADADRTLKAGPEPASELHKVALAFAREHYQRAAESLHHGRGGDLARQLEDQIGAKLEKRIKTSVGLGELKGEEAREVVTLGQKVLEHYRRAVKEKRVKAQSASSFLAETVHEPARLQEEVHKIEQSLDILKRQNEDLKVREKDLEAEKETLEVENKKNALELPITKNKNKSLNKIAVDLRRERNDLNDEIAQLRTNLETTQERNTEIVNKEKRMIKKLEQTERAANCANKCQLAYWEHYYHAPSAAVLQSLTYLALYQLLRGTLSENQLLETVGWINLRNLLRTIEQLPKLGKWRGQMRQIRPDIDKMEIPRNYLVDYKAQDPERDFIGMLLHHMVSPDDEARRGFDARSLSGWPFFFKVEGRRVMGVSA